MKTTINRIFYNLLGNRYQMHYKNRYVNTRNITNSQAYKNHYKKLQNNYNTYNPLNARRHGFSRNQEKMALTVLRKILINNNTNIRNITGKIQQSTYLKNRLAKKLNRYKAYAYTHRNSFNFLANNLKRSRNAKNIVTGGRFRFNRMN
mgnify:CR=1 FL=1